MANNQVLASSSASATPNSNYIYEVFLNHRGPDVKKTFASHLYRRLISSGFRVFLDQEEMREGENISSQIEGAIATASVHVAIFSPRYAESKWCLDELLLMLKSGATIIPVFYHVNPSELRRTQDEGNCGKYAEALRGLEKKKRYEPNTVQKWRQALSSVADISGLELQECNGDEGELVDRVLQLVQKRARKPLLEVGTYQIGLEEKLEDFEWTMLSQQHSEEAKIAGIAGVGGVGKTTLAKLFFNRRRSDYERCCFLFDVREAASRGSLTSLQSKLCEDLTGRHQMVNSIDEGIAMLKDRVPPSQVLVILDDVDSVEQLRALFSPLQETVKSHSLILVTFRDKTLVKNCGIKESSIYNLTGLNREESQALFCMHAFQQPHPVVEFDEVVNQFLDACQGLPLSLRVIGALLHSESPDLGYWNAQLLRISRVLHPDIQSKLKISIDSLDEQERQIFLDIACFFIGEDREKAIKIWDESNWDGFIGFRNLENKYLVQVDHNNCIRMHDHLRDLGRTLAGKEPRLRLWHFRDDTSYNEFDQLSVRGINIQSSVISLENHLDMGKPFVYLRGLQLLRVEGAWWERISSHLRLPNILWLRWDFSSFNQISEQVSELDSEIVSSSCGFSESVSKFLSPSRPGCSEVASSERPRRYSSLSSCIPMQNLIVLEVFGSDTQLETLWRSDSEAPMRLRELNIDAAPLQIPKSIGKLKYLEKIELGYSIETLPEEFFHLRSLKHLRMRASMKLLPNAFGNLSNLQYLNLTGSCDLEMLPNSFGNLTNLQYLNLYGCSRLETLPPFFGNLIRLKHLYLKDCSQLTLGKETLGNIRTLESLDLSNCEKIEVLPPQVSLQWSLEKLILWNTGWKELPSDIGNLSNLEILKVSFEKSSMEVLPPSLGKLKGLKQLTLFGGNWKCLPDSVAQLKQLTDFTIDCGRLEYLPAGVRELENLKILKVTNCRLLREVPFGMVDNFGGKDASADQSGSMLFRLRQLDLHGTGITKLSFVEGVCPNLCQLDISDCSELVKVEALPKTLISLDLNGCRALEIITGFCGLTKLRELDMRKCEAVEELPGLETLKSLVHLRVSGCCKLQSITRLAQATYLQIPSSEPHHGDSIERGLFKDLNLWKEKMHGTQLDGKDFERTNHPEVKTEDFMGENERQLEVEDMKGENERDLKAGDFRRGNEQQLEGEGFNVENEMQLEVEDFMGENDPQGDADDSKSENELLSQGQDFRWGNDLRLGAELDFNRGNPLLLEAEDLSRQRNALLRKAKDLHRRENALRLEASQQLEAGHFAD